MNGGSMPNTDPFAPLRHRLSKLDQPIMLRVSSPAPGLAAAQATWDLLDQLLADQPMVSVHPGGRQAVESVVVKITKNGHTGPISFWGTPSGFELEGLVYALECLSGQVTPDLTEEQKALLRQISRPLAADLYVAPT